MQESFAYGEGEGSSRFRTVLITGVSKGLGRALAMEFARRGHTVVGCSRDQTKLDSLQSDLSSISSPNNHFLFNADTSSNRSTQDLARSVSDRNLVPDIIVNNAAIINRNAMIWEIPAQEFDAVIDTNIKGTANILRHFIPLMIESKKKQGIIVNMSSMSGRDGFPMVSAYCASKWGVEGLTKSIAKELPEGIAIVALDPGVIYTDMLVSCCGSELAAQYPYPHQWAIKATTKILDFTTAENGASPIVDD